MIQSYFDGHSCPVKTLKIIIIVLLLINICYSIYTIVTINYDHIKLFVLVGLDVSENNEDSSFVRSLIGKFEACSIETHILHIIKLKFVHLW